MSYSSRLVVLAGEGIIPSLVAEEAIRRGVETLYLPIVKGYKAPQNFRQLHNYVPATKLGAILKIVKDFQATEIVMVGKVPKKSLYLSRMREYDFKTFWLLRRLINRNDLSIFRILQEEFAKIGVTIVSQSKYLESLLDYSGILTRRKPTRSEMQDIRFGMAYAREIARLDIGQTIVVKKKAVISVEAIEGTDETIRRSREYINGKGGVVCKVARPFQDLRFDIPTVGPDTLKQIKYAGCSVLAIEERKTFMVHKEKMVAFANENNLTIFAGPAEKLEDLAVPDA